MVFRVRKLLVAIMAIKKLCVGGVCVQRRTYALGFQNKVADSTRIPEKKVADSSRIPGKKVAGILLNSTRIPGFRVSGILGN